MSNGPVVADLLSPPDLRARVSRAEALGLATADGLSTLLEMLRDLVHTAPETALDLAELCEVIAGPLDLGLAAKARYLHARVLADRGDFDAALTLIGQARSDWFNAGDPVAALRTDLGRMQVLDDLGRHHDAVEAGRALISGLDELPAGESGEQGWLRAAAYENLGAALGFIGKQYEALDCYQRAEAAYELLGMPEEVARPRANRGIELLQLGRAREGLAALGAAAAIFAESGDRLWASKCDGHIAEAHRLLGDPVQALRLLQSAEATVAELGATAESVRLRLVIADTYLDLGLYDEALAVTTEIAGEAGRLGMRHDSGVADYLAGIASLSSNDPAGADRHLSAAAAAFAEVADAQFAARTQLAQASVSRLHGRIDQARVQAAQAAEALAAGNWPVPLYWTKLMQADLSPDPLAESYLEEASALLSLLPVPPLRYPYLIRVARAHRRAGRLDECEQELRAAVELVEEVSATLPDHLMRTAYRADKSAAYDELIALLAGRDDPASLVEAAAVADRAKARTLVDLLHGSVSSPTASTDKLGAIRAELNAVYSSLLENGTENSAELLKHAEQLERQATVLRLGQWQQRPDGEARPLSPQSKPTDAPTIAYHVVEDDVHVFVSGNGESRAVRLVGVVPELSLVLERLSAQWQRFRLGGRLGRLHGDTFIATANDLLRSLYRLLIEPVRPQLDAFTGADLVIVPHRLLGQVPFHALYDGSAHLVDRWAVTIAPTSSALSVRRAAPAGPDAPRGLVLAVPDENIPAVEAEAAAVAACLTDTTVLIGAEATAEALRAATPGPAYVHIACHGLYRPSNPLFSSLRLADGWSTAAQLLDLDLGGALVTLSACESGRRDDDRPEPVGLAWAFLAAGASGAIVSQWLVDDEVTQQTMTTLYSELTAGRPPAQALRAAQLAIRRTNPHPFHWAPFTFVSSTASSAPGRKP